MCISVISRILANVMLFLYSNISFVSIYSYFIVEMLLLFEDMIYEFLC